MLEASGRTLVAYNFNFMGGLSTDIIRYTHLESDETFSTEHDKIDLDVVTYQILKIAKN